MSAEAFCPEHGPYDSKHTSCPYCAQEKGGLPPAPRPLEDDETYGDNLMPSKQAYGDDEPTELPGFQGVQVSEDDATELPRRMGSGIQDDDDVTIPPTRKMRRILDDPYDDDDIDMTVIDREDTSMLGWLIVKSSPYMRRGQVLKIKSGAIYGRHPNKADFLIDDDKVSGIHARIQIKDEQFILIDLGSANGTLLNGEELSEAKVLKQDDEIRMGDTVFVLKTL